MLFTCSRMRMRVWGIWMCVLDEWRDVFLVDSVILADYVAACVSPLLVSPRSKY